MKKIPGVAFLLLCSLVSSFNGNTLEEVCQEPTEDVKCRNKHPVYELEQICSLIVNAITKDTRNLIEIYSMEGLKTVGAITPNLANYQVWLKALTEEIDEGGRRHLTALCSRNDPNKEMCSQNPPMPRPNELPAFKHLVRIVYIDSMKDLQYIGVNMVKETFPNIHDLAITNNSKLLSYTIPSIGKNRLQRIFFKNNRNLRVIKSHPDSSPIEVAFMFEPDHTDTRKLPPLDYLEIQSFPINSLYRYFVRTTADQVNITAPTVIPGSAGINYFHFIYEGNNPMQVKIDYSKFQSVIKNINMYFKSEIIDLDNVLPPPGIMSKANHVVIVLNMTTTYTPDPNIYVSRCIRKGNRYYSKQWTTLMNSKHKIIIPKKYAGDFRRLRNSRPLISDPAKHTYKFLYTDVTTLSKFASENTKIIIYTYFLLVPDTYNLPVADHMEIHYQYLVCIDSNLFGFSKTQLDKNQLTFHRQKQILTKFQQPFKLTLIFELLIAFTEIMKPIGIVSNEVVAIKARMMTELVRDLKLEMIVTSIDSDQKHFLKSLANRLDDFTIFIDSNRQQTRRLPLLSINLYKEKTSVFQQMARNVFDAKTVVKIQSGNSLLLDVAKVRTGNDENIARGKDELLKAKLQGVILSINQARSNRLKFQKDYEKNLPRFRKAVQRQQAHAYIDVVIAVFSFITNIFSGDDGLTTQLRSNIKKVETAKGLTRSLDRIDLLMSRLNLIIGIVGGAKDIENFVVISKEGFDPGFESPDTEKLNIVIPSTKNEKLKSLLNLLSELNTADILEWDLAKRHVDGMMDASLSADIPETLAFKTAIYKMIQSGKSEMEALMHYASLKSDIYINSLKRESFKEELAFIESADVSLNKDKLKENLELSTSQLKLDLFFHLWDYCDASFYHNLKPCTAYREFSSISSLSQIQHIIDQILLQSFNKLNNLYPPPQSFNGFSIKYEQSSTCSTIVKNCGEGINTQLCKTAVASYENKKYLGRLNSQLGTNKTDEVDLINAFKIFCDCFYSPVEELKQNNVTGIAISLDHPKFKGYDRVRVKEIQVFLDGIETASDEVEITISNVGILADRMKNEEFVFSSEKWKRTFRYVKADRSVPSIQANVDDDFEATFNPPTVFSTWVISVSEDRNPGLDLSNVTSIEFVFSGSLMVNYNN